MTASIDVNILFDVECHSRLVIFSFYQLDRSKHVEMSRIEIIVIAF
jgi:hypothetical protein